MLPATISVAGSWTSSGWKDVVLSQTDRTVKGHFDEYAIDGVVSGSKAYLLVSRDGWYRYSMVLEMPSPHLLIGYYSRSIPYGSSNRRDIRLDRIGPRNSELADGRGRPIFGRPPEAKRERHRLFRLEVGN